MLAFIPGFHLSHGTWPLGPAGLVDPEVSVYDEVIPPYEPYNANSQLSQPMDAVFTTKAPDYTSSNYPGMSAATYATVLGTSYPSKTRSAQDEAALATPTFRLANDHLWGVSKGAAYGPWVQPGLPAAFQDGNPSAVQVYQSVGKSAPGACALNYPV